MAQTTTATRGSRQRSTTSTAANGFTAEERSAMQERTRELKATNAGNADGESDVLAKIAEMSDHDRDMAERLHALVKATAPGLTSRTWYGMPAYAKDGNTVLFFKCAAKFKARYATLGFSDKANLDEEGGMWPAEFALKEWTPANEERIRALITKAIS